MVVLRSGRCGIGAASGRWSCGTVPPVPCLIQGSGFALAAVGMGAGQS